MVTDDEILKAICNFFVRSRDFNGTSGSHLATAFNVGLPELQEQLGRLIVARYIDLAFESHSVNPHIKRLADLPVDVQLAKLAKEDMNGICIYPGVDIITTRPELRQYDDRFYTHRLALAEPQLRAVFFELNVPAQGGSKYLLMQRSFGQQWTVVS